MDLPDYPHDLSTVDCINATDFSQLPAYIERHKPFLAKGFADTWPLLKLVRDKPPGNSRISLFKDLLGDTKLRFTFCPAEQEGDLGMGDDLKANFYFNDKETPACEFLDSVSDLITNPTGACVYAQALKLVDYPEVSALVPRLDSIEEPENLRYSKLWIGSGNHVVDLHYDNARNFISMIEGVKRITLLPPEALPHIYPAPLHRVVGGVTRSLVKLLNVDLGKFPRFQSALEMAQVTVVEPGDMLFIPPLWWHHVESYGFNVMINSWYEDNPPAVRTKIRSARAAWEDALCQLSRIDGKDVAKCAALYDSLVFAKEHKPVADSHLVSSLPSWSSRRRRMIKRNLISARDTFTSVPEAWQRYFRLMYDYYVLRVHGDPYPTLPGALSDVAKAIRYRPVRKQLRRTKAGLLRLVGR